MSRAAYIPDFGSVLLPQIVMLKGWGDRVDGVETNNGESWGRGGARSVVSHSTGKRAVKVTFPGMTGPYPNNNFYFGIATGETTIDDRPFDPNTGAMALFVNRHGGSTLQTGVMSEWYQLGQSETVNLNPATSLDTDHEYFIYADFNTGAVEFSAVSGGVVQWSVVVNVPAGQEWFIYRQYRNSYGDSYVNRELFDFTGETFEPVNGYKVWDAN